MSDETRSDDDPQDTNPAAADVPGDLDDSDFWDDDDSYADDGAPRRSGGMPPAWIIAAVVVALVVVGIVVLKGGGKDDDTTTTNASGASTTAAGGSGAKQCATWPGIGGLGEPKITAKPGIHVWSDLKGWHVSRVPGPAVPAVSATITNNDADTPPKPKDDSTGGATAVAEGQTVKITLPSSAEPSQASFEPGPYSSAVVIILNDDKGAALPTTAFTVGAGDQPSVNPITATQVMQPCDS